MSIPIDTRTVDLPEGHLRVLVSGDEANPSVILLHGGGIDSAWVSWRHLIPQLAPHYRVYAPDLPGYGGSAHPPAGKAYTTNYLIDTLQVLIDTLDVEKTALVGLSMGGAVSLGYTLAYPDHVTHLALVDSYGFQDYAPWQPLSNLALGLPTPLPDVAWWMVQQNRLVQRAGLTAIFRNPFKLTREVMDDASTSVHLDVFYAWLKTEITFNRCKTNYWAQLPTLHIPTLIIHGENDPSIPLKWAKRADQALPNSELVVIRNCGHWANREQPERVNRAVKRFLVG